MGAFSCVFLNNMAGEIDTLIQFIAEHFVFDGAAYPEIKGADEQRRLAFAIRHVALHLSKSAGAVSAVSEAADHGAEIDVAEIKKNIPKSLISTLRLASLVGMTEQEIIQAIEEKYRARIGEIENRNSIL